MMRESLARYQSDLQAIIPEVEQWTKRSRDALSLGEQVPMPPSIPEFPFGEKMFRPRCVTLHNGMIHPLKPFQIKGVLWYQGENNAGNAIDGLQYIEKKRAMLKDWREWFGDPELPFYFVQLAAWQKPTNDPANADGWALFRDAQRQCLSLPKTGMAVAIDIGDADDIHPKNKYDVGERLARWALVNQYSKTLEVSGPLYRELKIDGSKAIIEFDHIGNGLMVGRKVGRSAVEVTEGYRTWWSYIPHFIHTPGYVYAYAYGQLLALSVYRRYQERGEAFVPAYLDLLARGGSMAPEDLGRLVDCDLADPAFWDGGLAIIGETLELAEQAARDAGRI
jgi:hypothetical protein